MAKAKPPPKRPSRVGVKRGKYKPREKPNWNKEILARERAERKAKAKEAKAAERKAIRDAKPKTIRPSKARPVKSKPLVRSALNALPAEVLGLVALYILPESLSLADSLLPPGSTPYPALTKNVTTRLLAPMQRFGSIPQCILDLIHLSKCCRQTREVCQRLLREFGGSRPVKELLGNEKKQATVADSSGSSGPSAQEAGSSSAASNADREQPIATLSSVVSANSGDAAKDGAEGAGHRYLYLRLKHCEENGNGLFTVATQSADTLEHLVIYDCGKVHGSYSHCSTQEHQNASPINRTVPLQHGQPKDHIALPNLRSVQIGPNVCEECSCASIRLLTGRTFRARDVSLTNNRRAEEKWVLTLRQNAYMAHRYDPYSFTHAAAPNLEALQLFNHTKPTFDRYHHGSPFSDGFTIPFEDATARQKIKTLSLILPGLERRWGGFGTNGYSSNVHQKTREDVEKDLAERSRIYMTTAAAGPSTVRKQASEAKVLGKAKDKWGNLAKSVLVRPPIPRTVVGDTAARAAAALLVSTIKPRQANGKDKGKGKEKEVAVVEEAAKGTAGDPNTLGAAAASGASGSQDISSSPTSSPAVGLTNKQKRRLSNASSEDPDASGSDEEGLNPRPKIKFRPKVPQRSTAGHGGHASSSRRVKQELMDSDLPDDMEQDLPLTEYQRQAISNRVRLQTQFPALLNDIASLLPNLAALQIMRQGTMRIDIVEDLMLVEEYAETFVDPLRGLSHLEHLDLDLAVVGRREARDFPLGLVIPELPAGNTNPVVARDLAVRRMLREADIVKATREGDAWRRKVLDRFVLGPIVREGEEGVSGIRRRGGRGHNDYDDDEDSEQDDQDSMHQQDDAEGEEDDDDQILPGHATLGGAAAAAVASGSAAGGVGTNGSGSGSRTDPQKLKRESAWAWPKVMRSGSIYSVDLRQRHAHRGMLSTWEKGLKDQEEVLLITKKKVGI